MKKVVHAACPHDCPDACSVLITVEDGRATHIQGDPTHPVTRGFLCGKVTKYLDRVYSPERVLYPMRRKKNISKGAGARNAQDFERISWDAAFDEIHERFTRIAGEFGAEAILPYSYGGNLGTLNSSSMDRRFFYRLGASQLERTICSSAGEKALISVLGCKLGTETEAFQHARLIIAWAANIHGNNIHMWPFIEQARQQGAKLVVIDPYKTHTAACADWYLPVNPGTDAALALALMHVIINENLYDAGYVAQYTLGFAELRQRAQQFPPERVAPWTGISAEDICKLARDYATTRPAAIRLNYGVQRSERGGYAVRAIAMLPCITGAWKDLGGGLQLSTSDAWELNKQALTRPDLVAHSPLCRPSRSVNMSRLGEALNELHSPPIKALFVYNSNPATVAPNRNAVIRGLKREDLFTVVHEQFFTDTTDYADLVLPATTFFEHKDLQTSYGHYYLQMSHAAIAPLGECRSNVDMFRALAQRFGFNEDCFAENNDQMIDLALQTPNPLLAGVTRERLENENSIRINAPQDFLPFAQGNFHTASGKAELYSEALKAEGLDPVVEFSPPAESRHSPLAQQYPLELLARKADNFLNSTFANVPSVQQIEARRGEKSGGGPGILEMHERDAGPRGIREGDSVRVFNARGAVTLRAHVNGSVQPGVVAARLNWAKFSEGSVNINVLTSERLTDMGNAPAFYSALVEVERA